MNKKNISYLANLGPVAQLLEQSRKIVITTHIKPDGDAMGSSMGLYNFLKSMRFVEHDVTVITPSDYPANLSWLNGNDKVIVFSPETSWDVSELVDTADIIFCLDFSRLSRLEILGEMIKKSKAFKVNIDHHLEPEHFADVVMIESNAASTCSMMFNIFETLADWYENFPDINEDVAKCLYLGLMTDTGCFRHNNVNPAEFEIAASLVYYGANPNEIYRKVYETSSLERLQLIGFALSQKLFIIPEYNVSVVALSRTELDKYNAQTGDTEGLVNEGLKIETVKMSVLIYEKKNGELKLSFRSNGNVAVNLIAKHFDGGGHMNASGGHSIMTIEQTIEKLKNLLPQFEEMLK